MKKLLSLALVLAMALSLVSSLTALAAEDDWITLQIPVYDRNNPGLPPVDNNYWIDYIQEQFGNPNQIKLEYVAIPRTAAIDKFNSLILSGDAPDLIFDYDYPNMVAFASAGALSPIDMAQLQEVAPTFYASTQELHHWGVLSGEQMFLTANRPTAYNYATVIRQDWLDAVGKAMPANIDEYVDVLRAFKEAKLGGEDTVPLTVFLPQPNQFFDYAFRDYPYPEDQLAMYGDLAIAPFTTDSFKAMLQWYNTLYNEGLISPEFALDADQTKARADFMNGKAGVYGFYLQKEPPVIQTLMENVPDAKLSILSPLSMKTANGQPVEFKYAGYGMVMGINEACEHPEAVYKFLEWMVQPENLFILQNGVEGVHYTLDEAGLPVPVADYAGADAMNYGSNKDMWCVVIEGKIFGDGSTEAAIKAQRTYLPTGFEYLLDDRYADYQAHIIPHWYPNFQFDRAITSASEYSETLRAKFQQYTTELIMCTPEEFEAKYESSKADYLASGYQEVLDERLSVYNEITGK